MKRIFAFLALSIMLLCGCGRSDERIAADVKPEVEKILAGIDLENPVCIRLADIRRVDRDRYRAMAEVEHEINAFGRIYKKTEFLNIFIVYDKNEDVSVRIE